jgi:hypothetical protein
MEAAFKRPLAVDEKLHALQSDVAQLNGAKNRVQAARYYLDHHEG